ncbi:MAG: sulfotransferase [Gammaproteobacteria bacterium]|nr:sulfotransferase [Gammaproteobacteria bacterium]MBU1446704.1 sulfotransferase [Gammaproteobacteria bacterium]
MSSSHGAADGRTSSFSRNMGLEALLKDVNSSLWVAEQETLANPRKAEYPVILVMGPHRSGTTLFMQWLANTGLVAYPTNLLSRFYQAPIIGAKLQLLLTDPRFNFRDELGEFVQQSEFKSENGKTKGVLAPNEFWYFWRRFLAEAGRDAWTDEELKLSMDTQTLCAELAGMMDVFQKPFAAKGLLFNYNIPFLDSIFDKVLFVQIKRDPVTNVASVLEARKRQLGSEAEWYSFKIPEYEELKNLDPIAQAAGQVHCINKAVTRGLELVGESRKLVVQYEDFCEAPQKAFDQLTEKLAMQGSEYQGPASFRVTRDAELPNRTLIQQALSGYKGE